MSDLGAKIRTGTIWIFADNISRDVVNLAVGVVLARLLLPEHFGLVTTVGILTGLAGYFAGAGTGQALVRAKQVEQAHFNVIFTLQLGLSTVIYLIFILISSAFADFFGEPIYQQLLLASGLSFFLRPFTNLPRARLQREMRFRAITVIGLITLAVTGTLSIVLALMDYGAWSLVIAGLVGGVINALILSIYVGQKYAFAWDKGIVRDLGGYGMKVATNSLIDHFRDQSVLLLLSKLNGPADVGLYNRAASLAVMPLRIIGSAPYQAVFRALAAEQDNLDRSRYLYYRTITLVTTYTLPFYIMLWWLADPGIRFVYGDKWAASAQPLAILATAGLFACLANPSGAVIEARNRMVTEIKIGCAAWGILIAGVIYGLRWGLSGVACAVVATSFLHYGVLVVVAVRELKGTLRAVAKALGPALALNMLLLVVTIVADRLLLHKYLVASPGIYAILMSMVGVTTYSLLFLYMPIASIQEESAKWRRKIGLGRSN